MKDTHNHIRSRKAALIIVFILVFMLLSTLTASAYELTGWWIGSSKTRAFAWGDRLLTPNSVIRDAFESAISDWYGASKLDFYEDATSKNEFNSYHEVSSKIYGHYDLEIMPGTNGDKDYVLSFSVKINAGRGDITEKNVARSVANHELGHVAGLDDRTSGTSIMNVNRNRQTRYTPQADDRDGIRDIYSN